jgi:hypothetical protein
LPIKIVCDPKLKLDGCQSCFRDSEQKLGKQGKFAIKGLHINLEVENISQFQHTKTGVECDVNIVKKKC